MKRCDKKATEEKKKKKATPRSSIYRPLFVGVRDNPRHRIRPPVSRSRSSAFVAGNRDIINCDDPFTVLICPLFN